MRLASRAWAAVRIIHPAPALAVTLLSAALGAILLAQAGEPLDVRWAATVAAVAGSQIFTGATNDLVDRVRDEAGGRMGKPLPAGDLSPEGALWVASGGLALQLAASLRLGPLPLLLGAAATLSALSYNLWLSRTPFSVVPYLVSFGILPLWIAAGVGVDLARVVAAVPLVAPFAAAAHLVNIARDFEVDRATGSRNLAQVLGYRTTIWLAWAMSMAVGIGVGLALTLGGRTTAPTLVIGLIGVAAVAQGAGSAQRMWYGMLVAAVAWTTAWALSTG
jgi:4-hydroxybenzoate polyprenyltransferase